MADIRRSAGLAVLLLDNRLLEGDDSGPVKELFGVLVGSPAGMIDSTSSSELHKGQSGVSLEQHPGKEPESRVVVFEDAAEALKQG